MQCWWGGGGERDRVRKSTLGVPKLNETTLPSRVRLVEWEGKIQMRVAKNKTNAVGKRWPKQLKVLKRKLSHPPLSSPVFNQRSFFLCTLRPRLQIIKYYSHVLFILRNTEKLSLLCTTPSSFFPILINGFYPRGTTLFLLSILI